VRRRIRPANYRHCGPPIGSATIGEDVAPAEVRARLGHCPELAQKTKAAIPGAELIERPFRGGATRWMISSLSSCRTSIEAFCQSV
jgi:hypothetical protein